MLKLDNYGNLMPYQAIETDLEAVDSFFVMPFTASLTRNDLFALFSQFLNEIREILSCNFNLFIDGSFVSNKLNPNDIDVVLFVDYQIFELNEKRINELKKRIEYQLLDVYFEKIYPENHPFYIRYHSDSLYWNQLFTRSRQNRPKGYLIVKNHGK
jgi:hypothetical protein